MPGRTYKTVSDELVEHAEIVAGHFENSGYKVRHEVLELGFPYTPTFVCRRSPTTLILEVDNKVQIKRLDDWVRFAKSTGKDTRVALCCADSVALTPAEIAALRDRRIGIYLTSRDRVVEHSIPDDLGLNVALPDPVSLPREVQEKLGPAYEQFNRAQWREGFEDACQALETAARNYLNKWMKTVRVQTY